MIKQILLQSSNKMLLCSLFNKNEAELEEPDLKDIQVIFFIEKSKLGPIYNTIPGKKKATIFIFSFTEHLLTTCSVPPSWLVLWMQLTNSASIQIFELGRVGCIDVKACERCKSGFIVGMELEDFWGYVHFLPYKNMCIYTYRHRIQRGIVEIFKQTHKNQRFYAVLNLEQRQEYRGCRKSAAAASPFSFFPLAVSLAAETQKESFPGIIYAKSYFDHEILNKNFNSFIEEL